MSNKNHTSTHSNLLILHVAIITKHDNSSPCHDSFHCNVFKTLKDTGCGYNISAFYQVFPTYFSCFREMAI